MNSYRFALGILKLASMLPNTDEGRVTRRQLCKSGTSVGANLEKADGSLTLNDFVYKIDTAFKEAKETRYWLRIVIARKLLKKEMVIRHFEEAPRAYKNPLNHNLQMSSIIFRYLGIFGLLGIYYARRLI